LRSVADVRETLLKKRFEFVRRSVVERPRANVENFAVDVDDKPRVGERQRKIKFA
jgi:hypothetical protein